MSHPSTISGCWDIQRNDKWRSYANVKCWIVGVSSNISASSDYKRMKPPPFDAARRGDSNELRFILLWLLDAEIINEIRFFNFDVKTISAFWQIKWFISKCQNSFDNFDILKLLNFGMRLYGLINPLPIGYQSVTNQSYDRLLYWN